MRIPFWFGLIHVGRPTGIGAYRYDISATLNLWPRGDVPHGEYAWQRIWRVSWNWLPDRIYQHVSVVENPDKLAIDVVRRLRAAISGEDIAELRSKYQLACKYWNSFDSSRWTGRERKLVGFGIWQHEFWSYQSTRRSKMYVYLTGSKERQSPSHTVFIAPAAVEKKENCPAEWFETNGETPKQMQIVFHHGRASVDKAIGEWMIASGAAQKTNIIKRSGAMLGSLAGAIAGR